MTIVSMTGFAEAQGSREGARWRWEAKSVNGRSLDLRLRLPPGFDSIEAAARMLAADRFKRGNVQASLAFEAASGARGLRIDAAALASAVARPASALRRTRPQRSNSHEAASPAPKVLPIEPGMPLRPAERARLAEPSAVMAGKSAAPAMVAAAWACRYWAAAICRVLLDTSTRSSKPLSTGSP